MTSSIKSQQIVFPLDKIQAKLSVQGIYSIPQEWKTTDQSNPGLFTYLVRMSKFQILKGKICPRQLTQRQKREQQEKNKKGGKKDSKNPQPNQQQEKFKKIEQQKQRQRQQLFSKLNEEEQFHHTSEDIFRSPFLKFEQNSSETTFKGNDCLIFQQRLLKDKGDWIYIYKIPAVSEQQLSKMRKSKPKTLNNINDLNPVLMRAWVSFQQLSSQSNPQKQIQQLRCKIQQVDKTPQTSEPNLDKTYIKIKFSLQDFIVKQKDEYSISSLINDPQKPKQLAPQQKALQQLRHELSLAIESLAMQYSTMFWKQINMQQQQRNIQIYLNNKKNQTAKRKEQFLYDFNVTGKYKILKDRVKKSIVHLCQTKYKSVFAGMKSFNGIKCNSQDQIYSEIYNLLVASYQDMLFKTICQKEQTLGEVLILNNDTLKQTKENILNSYKEQTVIERVKRTIREYELVQNFQYGQEVLRKYIDEYPQLTQLKYQYGAYCLKYNLKPAKQVLPFIEEFLTKQKYTLTEDKKIQYMLILFNIGGENNLKGWIILREVIESQFRANGGRPAEALSQWLLLASCILKNIQKLELASKYKSYALRQYQRLKLLNQKSQDLQSNHKERPNKMEIPSHAGIANYTQLGTSEQLGKLYDNLISYLNKFSAFQLIKRILTQKPNSQSAESDQPSLQKLLPQMNQLLVSNNQESINRLADISLNLYQTVSASGSSQQKNIVMQFIQKAYLLKILNNKNKNKEDLQNLQRNLKKCLMTNNDPFSRFSTLLRLGYLYCQKQQYGNARACLLKYLQKGSTSYPEYLSGLSYKLLGIACLKLQRIDDAIQNFKHWNLSDTKNRDSWLYLALAFAKSDKLIIVNQCLNQYKKRVFNENSFQQNSILAQIISVIQRKNSQGDQYKNVLKVKILQALA